MQGVYIAGAVLYTISIITRLAQTIPAVTKDTVWPFLLGFLLVAPLVMFLLVFGAVSS